ncbi:MAG: hypothetical protein LBH43_20720, partial [Treponema sp.]|nr:hypothetical protein [Treponema sp.]
MDAGLSPNLTQKRVRKLPKNISFGSPRYNKQKIHEKYTRNGKKRKQAHCLKIILAQKGTCLKTKNLAQITMAPTATGGASGVRHE